MKVIRKSLSEHCRRRHLRRGHTRLTVMQIDEVVRQCSARTHGLGTIEVRPYQYGKPYLFSLRKIEQYSGKICSMLGCINPLMNQLDGGHPMPWFYAVTDRWNKRWTKFLADVDALLALGRAAGMVRQVNGSEPEEGDDAQLLKAAVESGVPCVVIEQVKFNESSCTVQRRAMERRKRAERRANKESKKNEL